MRRLVIATLVAASALTALPAAAQEASQPSPTPPAVAPAVPPVKVEVGTDPEPSDSAALGFLWDAMNGRIFDRWRDRASQWIRQGFEVVASLLRTTDVTKQDRVRQLWAFCAGVAGLMLVAMIALGGTSMALTESGYLTAKELAGRVVVAVLMIGASLLVTGVGIRMSNDMVSGILSSQPDRLQFTAERIVQGGGLMVLLAPLLLVGVLLLAGITVFRIALVFIYAVAAPVALLGWAHPAGEGFARAWWRGMAALLAAPIVQAFLMWIGVYIFLTGTGTFFSGTNDSSGIVDALALLVVIFLMIRVVLWMLKQSFKAFDVGRLAVAFGRGKRLIIGA